MKLRTGCIAKRTHKRDHASMKYMRHHWKKNDSATRDPVRSLPHVLLFHTPWCHMRHGLLPVTGQQTGSGCSYRRGIFGRMCQAMSRMRKMIIRTARRRLRAKPGRACGKWWNNWAMIGRSSVWCTSNRLSIRPRAKTRQNELRLVMCRIESPVFWRLRFVSSTLTRPWFGTHCSAMAWQPPVEGTGWSSGRGRGYGTWPIMRWTSSSEWTIFLAQRSSPGRIVCGWTSVTWLRPLGLKPSILCPRPSCCQSKFRTDTERVEGKHLFDDVWWFLPLGCRLMIANCSV